MPHPRGKNASPIRPLSAIIAALGVVLIGSAGAQAQDAQGLEPTQKQYNFNERGTRAYNNKQYAKALELYQQALALGELNTLYLNLARTYQRLGKCVDAELAFRKALTSPAVIDPPPAKVREAVKRFRADDKEVCYGRLTLSCDIEGMKVVLNDDEEAICDGTERPAPPGPYKIVASGWGQERTFTAEVKPGQSTAVSLTLDLSADDANAWELVEQARGDLRTGALEGAGRKLTQATALNDTWWEPHALLAQVAQGQDRLQDAKNHLTQALARSPEDIRPQLESSLAELEQKLRARNPDQGIAAPTDVSPAPKSTLGGWILLSTGVASMAVGGIFAFQVSNTNDKIAQADLARVNADQDVAFGADSQGESNDLARQVESLTQEGEQQRLLAGLSLGVGAGLAVGGLIWLLLNDNTPSNPPTTAQNTDKPTFEPMISSDGFGATMHWNW